MVIIRNEKSFSLKNPTKISKGCKSLKSLLNLSVSVCVVAQVWRGVGETRRFERQRQMPYGRWYSQQKEKPLGSVDI